MNFFFLMQNVHVGTHQQDKTAAIIYGMEVAQIPPHKNYENRQGVVPKSNTVKKCTTTSSIPKS
jgi:hypothetical protein